MTEYRFRPRFVILAWSAIGVGGFAMGMAWVMQLAGQSLWVTLGFGAAGVVLGSLYLASPAWRYRALVDDDGLEVIDGRGDRRFRIEWSEVDRCIASPSTKTCYVSGGSAERSLIVPGQGAVAPYDIDHKRALYDEIVKRVPPERIEQVDLVEHAER
jgi:hypothetical protein